VCFRRRFGVKQKLQLTLALPLTFGILIAVYVAIKLLLAHTSEEDFDAHFAMHHQGRTMTQAILKQVVTIVISGFMFGSVFFLKNVLIPWSCTPPDDAGRTYIRSQPDTPCDLDDEEYATIYALAWTGLVTYLGMFGTFVFFLYKDKCEKWFDFLGDKFDAEFFYWEVMLLIRKLLIMVAFMFFADSTEKSWFVGASVVIISLLFHVFAKPFEDTLIDWCEFLSLVATLFICMSGIVFKLLNDPLNPKQTEDAQMLSNALEALSILLMLATCVLSMIIEVHTYKNVTDTSQDYKVKMLDKHIHITLADLATQSKLLDAAKAKAKEALLLAEEHRKDESGVDEPESSDPGTSAYAQPSCFKKRDRKNGDTEKFENPISEDDNAAESFEGEDIRSFEDEDSSLPEEDPGENADTSSHALLLVHELAQLKRTTDKRNAQAMEEVVTTNRLLVQAQAELKAAKDKAQAELKAANDQAQAELKAANDQAEAELKAANDQAQAERKAANDLAEAELKAAEDALQQTQDRNDGLTKELERLKLVQVAAVESSGTTDVVVVQSQRGVETTTRQTKDKAGEARVGAISTRADRDPELGRPEFHRGELLAATQKLTVRTSRKKGSHHVVQLKKDDSFEVLDVVIDDSVTWLQVKTQSVKGKSTTKNGWVRPLDRSGNLHVKRVALDPTA
jgi:hypothetical protein